MSYTVERDGKGKAYIQTEYTVASHLASAIINGDYSSFDYYNEDSKPFKEWLQSVAQDMDDYAFEEHCKVNSLIHNIDDQDSFFATCDYYNLKADCVTLQVLAICTDTKYEQLNGKDFHDTY